MSFNIPTKEPASLTVGTSLIFDRSWPEFPAADWTLNYYFRNAQSAPINILATANGNDFRVNVAPTVTVDWIKGIYDVRGIVTETAGTEKHQVFTGKIELCVDPVIEENYDGRTYWEKRLDAIEAGMANTAPDDPISYSINGRSFTFGTAADKHAEWSFANARVNWEKHRGHNRKILVRRVSPR